MESRSARLDRIAPRRVRAQAALWVTELHGPDRDAGLESRVRRWIAEHPSHAAAFELATEAWQRSGNLPADLPTCAELLGGGPRDRGRRPSRGRPAALRSRRALAGMLVSCAAIAAAICWLRYPAVSTGPREQRTVELADGTEVALNANTRLTVQFDARERRVTLERGEALFDVAKHERRPFAVVAGDRKIVATGTSFLVRVRDPRGSAFDVTLVEGHVVVEPLAPAAATQRSAAPRSAELDPGQRLRFSRSSEHAPGAGADQVDSPSLERITAWRRGQLIFEDTSLADAAAEFNRYDPDRIEVSGESVRRLRVGGVFRIGDAASFAQAIAVAHRLRVLHHGSALVIAAPTGPPP